MSRHRQPGPEPDEPRPGRRDHDGPAPDARPVRNGTPRNGVPVTGTPRNGTPVGGTPVGGTGPNGSPVTGTPVNGTPVDRGARHGRPADGTAVDGTPVDGAARNGAPVNGAAPHGRPVNGAARNGTPVDGATRNGRPVNGTARSGTSLNGTPLDGAAHHGAAHNGTPLDGAARNGTPVDGAARNGTPVDGPAHNGTPVNGAARHGDGGGGGDGVNGSANGAAPRNGRPRPRPGPRPNGSGPAGEGDSRGRRVRAQPSSIADFARPTGRPDADRGPDRDARRGGPGPPQAPRVPDARAPGDAERAVARTVVPAQRDRSGRSGPHRPADGTDALHTRPPAVPQAVPPPGVPPPRPAPARPAPDGPAPGAPAPGDPAPPQDAVPTARVPVVAPRPAPDAPGVDELGRATTERSTTLRPGTADRDTTGGHAPAPAGPRSSEADTDPARTADPAPATTAVPVPPTVAPDRAEHDPAPDPKPAGSRLLGVDAARGVALFGIIAVHALVEGTDDGAPAANYLVFGGRSAALFALLAGVALAFMTGRRRVRWGRDDLGGAAAMVAARAGVLLVIGLALGWTDPEIAAVILPYYAVMFLLAIPLLVLPTGVLAGLTVVLVGAVPVLSQLVRPGLPVPTLDNPHLVDVVTDPLGLLSELTVTGAYPAATWLAYLAAGLVIGRLRLSSARTAWTLFGAGAAAALAAAGASWWLLGPAGGYAHIAAATPPAQLETAPTVPDFVAVFPDGVTPTTTWWWLATIAPHSGTPLDLVQTIGSAAAVLGAALLLAGIARPAVARTLGYVLRPVAAAGSMTLTLYVVSLLFMNSPLDDYGPLEGYLWQVGAALVIGTAWRRAVGRGPLEAATSTVAKAARDRVRRGRARDRVGGADPPGPPVADAEAPR